jgi:hypothetical protein
VGGALDERTRGQVPEVVRREVREERKPHVRGRAAVREPDGGMLLEIVRGQPMVFRADVGLEEGPGPAREVSKEERLVDGELGFATDDGTADPPRDGG